MTTLFSSEITTHRCGCEHRIYDDALVQPCTEHTQQRKEGD